jgi:Flp pilus assembly protein TadG
VEVALAVPLLLVVLLGMTDLGRAFYYSSAVASGARSAAAAYAAKNDATTVQAIACPNLGSGCVATVVNSCSISSVSDASVEVRYHFELVSGFLTGYFNIFTQHDLRGCATYPRTGS